MIEKQESGKSSLFPGIKSFLTSLKKKLVISVARCQPCKIRPRGYFSNLLAWLLSALKWPNLAVTQLFTFPQRSYHTLPHSKTLSPSLSPLRSSSRLTTSGKSFQFPSVRAGIANRLGVPVALTVLD